MPMPMVRLAWFATMLAVVGCTKLTGFACDEDVQCSARAGGQCLDGGCTYPDDDCESRRRWSDDAPHRAGRCVDPSPGGSSSSSSSSSSDAATSTSGGGTTHDGSTTGTPEPIPLGRWPLDDGQGTIAVDVGRGGHDGMVLGASWTAGRNGGALVMDADGDGVEVGTFTEYDLVDAAGLTLMGWARFDDFTESNCSIIARIGAYGLRFFGNHDDGITPVMVINPAGASADGDTDGPIDPFAQVVCYGPLLAFIDPPDDGVDATKWHHYAGTYDVASRSLRFYLDGVEACSVDASADMLDGTLALASAPLELGRWRPTSESEPANTLLGAIDDVRIYDEAIAPEIIAAIVGP